MPRRCRFIGTLASIRERQIHISRAFNERLRMTCEYRYRPAAPGFPVRRSDVKVSWSNVGRGVAGRTGVFRGNTTRVSRVATDVMGAGGLGGNTKTMSGNRTSPNFANSSGVGLDVSAGSIASAPSKTAMDALLNGATFDVETGRTPDSGG